MVITRGRKDGTGGAIRILVQAQNTDLVFTIAKPATLIIQSVMHLFIYQS